jgi:hypothetical protein
LKGDDVFHQPLISPYNTAEGSQGMVVPSKHRYFHRSPANWQAWKPKRNTKQNHTPMHTMTFPINNQTRFSKWQLMFCGPHRRK